MDADQHEEEKEEEANSGLSASKKIKAQILDTGRLFIRNLAYTIEEDQLKEVFGKHGEIAEIQVIIDKKTGKCKGFALVTFIFPEHAFAAYKALDGTIFRGRMLHILAGENKLEPKLEPQTQCFSKFQQEKQQNLKENATKSSHVWNPLYMGGSAAAETLADQLQIPKWDLVAEKSQNSR